MSDQLIAFEEHRLLDSEGAPHPILAQYAALTAERDHYKDALRRAVQLTRAMHEELEELLNR